jgi:hypothetical protein
LNSFNRKIIRYKKRGYAELGLFFSCIPKRRGFFKKKGKLLRLFRDNIIP